MIRIVPHCNIINFSSQNPVKSVSEVSSVVALKDGEKYLFNPEGKFGKFLKWVTCSLKNKDGSDKLMDVFNVEKGVVEKHVKTRYDVFNFHLPNVHGAFISTLYIINTKMSKDIPEERKPTLILNNAINGILAISATYALIGVTNKMRAKFIKNVVSAAKEMFPESDLNKMARGAGLLSRLLIASIIFRYLTPVFATPLADKATRFLVKKSLIKNPDSAAK